MLWLAILVVLALQLDTYRRFERIEKAVGGMIYRENRSRGFSDYDAHRLS